MLAAMSSQLSEDFRGFCSVSGHQTFPRVKLRRQTCVSWAKVRATKILREFLGEVILSFRASLDGQNDTKNSAKIHLNLSPLAHLSGKNRNSIS